MEILEKINEVGSNLQKAQIMLFTLPLLSLIFYKANFILTSVYVFLLAINLLYVHTLISFKNEATKDVFGIRKDKLKPLWYIPILPLFVILTIINITAFIISFILSIVYLDINNSFNYSLFLLHIFVISLSIFILIFINNLKKKVSEAKII